jgi:hypothetical protein
MLITKQKVIDYVMWIYLDHVVGRSSSTKVTVSIHVSDPFPHPMITIQCTFPLTYSCTIPEGAMNASA